MDDVLIEKVVTIVGMLFWFAFPVGMMIAVIQQSKDAHHGKIDKEGHESPYSEDYKRNYEKSA